MSTSSDAPRPTTAAQPLSTGTTGPEPTRDGTTIVSALDPRCDLPGALAEWRLVVGDEFVQVDDPTLTRYAATTSASSRRPAAVLRPNSRDEVAAIVKVARRCRTPLYPISRGQNWGYGDACAVYDGQVIVDLSRMNRIEHVDAELGYAVIEPGVTQRQLSEHLRDQAVPFWMDCTGAGPNSSLIGNIVERGFGHSPYGNRFQTVSGMEVVLGTGEVLRTGFGRFEGAKTTYLYPYGVGPYLDGLFTQSNFGIVTRLGLWLMPIPESFCPFIVLFRDTDDLLAAITPLRELRMHGVLPSLCHIGNDLRALAADAPFPRDRLPGRARLTPEVRAALRHEAGIGAWSMSGALYGSRPQVAANRRRLKAALRQVDAKIVFLTPFLLAWGQRFAHVLGRLGPFRGLDKKVRIGAALAGMHSGVPSGAFLRGSYWRHPGGVPADFSDDADLAADGVGIIWMAPIIPFRREDFEVVNREMESLFERFDFDCHLTVNMINPRSLAAVCTIDYDPHDPSEVERAGALYEAGIRRLLELGYPMYRASTRGMTVLQSETGAVLSRAVEGIKDALDPGGVVAPGRYDGVGQERS